MEKNGTHGFVFDVERFSTVDGPGIRTVIFFKGCNLKCFWCHNPESIRREAELELDESSCIRCGLCVAVCPENAHSLQTDPRFMRERCKQCFRCSEICPTQALKRVGQWLSVEDCMDMIRQDVPFYRHSGGGVTLSGGEVLLQSDFAEKLLKRCTEENIHTAIESNLCFPKSRLEQLLPYLNLVMADIKQIDPDKHRQGTGASNHQVFENLRYLNKRNVPVILRTPIIPGYNDDLQHMEQATINADALATQLRN